MINLKYFEMNGHIVGLGRELLDESKSVGCTKGNSISVHER
jgi:hypothetical protein